MSTKAKVKRPVLNQEFSSMLAAERYVREYSYSQGYSIIGNGTGTSTRKTLKCSNPDVWFSEAQPCQYGFRIEGHATTGIATIVGMTLSHKKGCLDSLKACGAIQGTKKSVSAKGVHSSLRPPSPKLPAVATTNSAAQSGNALAIGTTFSSIDAAKKTIKAVMLQAGFNVSPHTTEHNRARISCKYSPDASHAGSSCPWKVVLARLPDKKTDVIQWTITDVNLDHNAGCIALHAQNEAPSSVGADQNRQQDEEEDELADASDPEGEDETLGELTASQSAPIDQDGRSGSLVQAGDGAETKRRSHSPTIHFISKKPRVEQTPSLQPMVKKEDEDSNRDLDLMFVGYSAPPQPHGTHGTLQGSSASASTFLNLPDVVAEALANDGISSLEAFRALRMKVEDVEEVIQTLRDHHGISKIHLSLARKRMQEAIRQFGEYP